MLLNSITDYISEIKRIRKDWSSVDPYPDIWFRGSDDASLKLLPGAYWRENCDEISMASTFRAMSPMLLEPRPQNDWEWYYVMQHYGVPTRLLDWTESPLQALHFALTKTKLEENPCVWVLDPVALNYTTQKSHIIYVPMAFDIYVNIDAWLPHRCYKDAEPENLNDHFFQTNRDPIAIYPSRSNSRLFAQRGTFTVHGTNPIPLEELGISNQSGDERLHKLEFNKNSTKSLLEDLWALGVNMTTTFPEPASIAADIKRMFGIED